MNTNYQNWAAEQNDPYKRLGFMSDIVRGSPVSGLGSNVYQAAPSSLGQVATLGAAAMGALGGKAAGGSIKSKKPAGLAALLIHGMA